MSASRFFKRQTALRTFNIIFKNFIHSTLTSKPAASNNPTAFSISQSLASFKVAVIVVKLYRLIIFLH